MEDEYKFLGNVNPQRRKRFFKYLIRSAAKVRAKKNLMYRSHFVKNIDKLRTIEDLKDLNKKKDSLGDVEQRIQNVIEKEHMLENEELYDRKFISKVSEREQKDHEIIVNVLKEKDESLRERLHDLEKRLTMIKQSMNASNAGKIIALEKRIERLQQLHGLKKEESVMKKSPKPRKKAVNKKSAKKMPVKKVSEKKANRKRKK